MTLIIIITCLIILFLEIYNIIILRKKIKNYSTYRYCSFYKFFNDTGFPVIVIKINNKSYNFLIDSGCQRSLISMNVYNKNLQTCSTKTNILESVEDNPKTNLIKLDFLFNNKHYKDVLFLPYVIKNVILSKKNNIVLHGILGNDFLKKYNWGIEYEQMRIKMLK